MVVRETKKRKREGGQGPPHSATGKTAINNLHHLSLCAPVDHSTNRTHNLRLKHTHPLTRIYGANTHTCTHAHTKKERMHRFALKYTCANTHTCVQEVAHPHMRRCSSPVLLQSFLLNFWLQAKQQRPNDSSETLFSLSVFRIPTQTSVSLSQHSRKCSPHSPAAFCFCGGHVKFMQCMSPLASTRQ